MDDLALAQATSSELASADPKDSHAQFKYQERPAIPLSLLWQYDLLRWASHLSRKPIDSQTKFDKRLAETAAPEANYDLRRWISCAVVGDSASGDEGKHAEPGFTSGEGLRGVDSPLA